MQRNFISRIFAIAIAVRYLLMLSAIGCQSEIRKQAPVAQDYFGKGVQYFPAGPEFKLTNQVQAIEEYKLEREKLRAGLEEDDH